MQIKELATDTEIKDSFKIMSQIYQDLDEKNYIVNVLNAIINGYKMTAVYKEEKIVAVIGIVVCDNIKYGKIIRIEDFMICRSNRGIGAAKMLLKWVDWQALEFNTDIIMSNLASQRKESHKIFLREGFLIDGINFLKG
ncbi:MAG: hypothetical protein ACI9IL_000563 [Rickettsiales bacterium]|jgi:hypothetical protein